MSGAQLRAIFVKNGRLQFRVNMSKFLEKIVGLKKDNLYRELAVVDVADGVVVKKNGVKLISFASNDYFGLSQNLLVKKAACDAIKKYGVSQGSSRYICGNNSFYQKLEKQIAQMKNCDDAIVFSSGYQAAIGAVPALVGENDLVVADKLIHACLLDGIKLSGAKLLRFAHNDTKHARMLIEDNIKKYQKILIITEDVFSMDGDVGLVEQLQGLAQEFGCLMLSDGAHGLFAGDGFKSHKNLLRMGTFSKAVGSFGGYVAGDKIMIDYLRNFAKSAIYTTALPASVLAASLQSLKLISKNNYAKKVLENAQYFCKLMNLPKAQSAIVVIKIGDNKKVMQIAKNLEEQGFLISAIRPPTVEPKGARLRITFSALHNKKQIDALVLALKKCC